MSDPANMEAREELPTVQVRPWWPPPPPAGAEAGFPRDQDGGRAPADAGVAVAESGLSLNWLTLIGLSGSVSFWTCKGRID